MYNRICLSSLPIDFQSMGNIQNYNYFDPYLIVHLTNYKRKLQNSIPSSIRFVITILLS